MEPTELQALPAELLCKQDSELDMREAEPQMQYVTRQEPGNEPFLVAISEKCHKSIAISTLVSWKSRAAVERIVGTIRFTPWRLRPDNFIV